MIRRRRQLQQACEDCERQPSKIDPILAAYRSRPECLDTNIMISKSCRVYYILNQTLSAREGDFEVFCMEAGDFARIVSPVFFVSSSRDTKLDKSLVH